MKRVLSTVVLSVFLICGGMSATTYAKDIDSVGTQGEDSNSDTTTSRNEGVSGYLKDYTPVTNENMENASNIASPIVNFIGNLVGFIFIVTSAGIFAVTALDLAYIGIPFVRPFLSPAQGQSSGGMSGGMGMGGGFGGQGLGGGFGGQGMGGGAQQPQGKQWVSDEVLAVMAEGGAQQQGSMSGGMGGMGGFGGMGGMGGAQQQPVSTKSRILEYFKKRLFFLILFAVASIMLTSSIFTDCGINVAELLFKIMDKVNSAIGGAMG